MPSENSLLATRLYDQVIGSEIKLPGGVLIERVTETEWKYSSSEKSFTCATPEETANGALRLARTLAKPNAN